MTQFQVGDRVYANTFFGAYSELIRVDVNSVYHLPNSVSFAQGTAVANSYPTAYYALYNLAQAKSSEIVFVHGGSGAVGSAAVQIAKAAGMTVVATAGSDRGLDLVQKEGADYALNHHDPDYQKTAMELTNKKGYDVILEMNATKKVADDVNLIGKFGRIILIGGTDGCVNFDPTLILWKGASIVGLYIGLATPKELTEIHQAIATGLENNSLRPAIAQEFTLHDVAKAHEVVRQASSSGKIVLTF